MTRRPPHLLDTSTCCQATMTCWIGSGGRQGNSSMGRGLRRRVSIPWYVFIVVIFIYIYYCFFMYVFFFWDEGQDLAWTFWTGPGPANLAEVWPGPTRGQSIVETQCKIIMVSWNSKGMYVATYWLCIQIQMLSVEQHASRVSHTRCSIYPSTHFLPVVIRCCQWVR